MFSLREIKHIGQRYQFACMLLPNQEQANSLEKFTMQNNNYNLSIMQHSLSIVKMYSDQVFLVQEIYTHSRQKKEKQLTGYRGCACSLKPSQVFFMYFIFLFSTDYSFGVSNILKREKECS